MSGLQWSSRCTSENWRQKQYQDYEVLYLASHGSPGAIHLGRTSIGFDELADCTLAPSVAQVTVISPRPLAEPQGVPGGVAARRVIVDVNDSPRGETRLVSLGVDSLPSAPASPRPVR